MFPTASALITANPGGGFAKAVQLSQDFNVVNVVGTIGDSVKLPVAGSPSFCFIINTTSKAIQVYGNGTDTVNGAASIPQLGGSIDIYVSIGPGQWFVEPGLGFSGGFPTESSTNAIVATPSGTQANSVPLTSALNRVATVATIGDAALLPIAAPGMMIQVSNAAANSMNIFPGVGDAINALGANAAFAVAGGKTVQFSACAAGIWHTVLSA